MGIQHSTQIYITETSQTDTTIYIIHIQKCISQGDVRAGKDSEQQNLATSMQS